MDQLKKRNLGRTGLQVVELGFGGWPIGGVMYGQVKERDALATVNTYLEAGGNLLDTAHWSGYGNSEKIIGKAVRQKGVRDKIYICTKTNGGETIDTISEIRPDLEKSLKLLQTEYIDLYYLHRPPEDHETMNRALDVFQELKEEGKIRAIGASIKGANVTSQTVDLCSKYIRSGKVDAIQIVYSIIRQKNVEIFNMADSHGVGIVARTALESGFLTGKYKPGHVITEGHRSRWNSSTQREILELAEEIAKWAIKPPYTSLSQVAIQFSLEPREVSALIVGAKNTAQILQNVKAAKLPSLDNKIVKALKRRFKSTSERFNIQINLL